MFAFSHASRIVFQFLKAFATNNISQCLMKIFQIVSIFSQMIMILFGGFQLELLQKERDRVSLSQQLSEREKEIVDVKAEVRNLSQRSL